MKLKTIEKLFDDELDCEELVSFFYAIFMVLTFITAISFFVIGFEPFIGSGWSILIGFSLGTIIIPDFIWWHYIFVKYILKPILKYFLIPFAKLAFGWMML